MARRHMFICDACGSKSDLTADECLPPGWMVTTGISMSGRVVSVETCSTTCIARALGIPGVPLELSVAGATPALGETS